MSYFEKLFRQTLDELERRRESEPMIEDALRRYGGRSIHLVIRGDGEYLFLISSEGVTLQIDPDQVPDDIFVEMDFARARRLIEERSFSPFDLLFVRYKNVKVEDIEFVRTLLRG